MISASEDNLSVSAARKKVFQSQRCCLSAQNNVLDIAGKIAVTHEYILEEIGKKKKRSMPHLHFTTLADSLWNLVRAVPMSRLMCYQ